MLRRRSFLVAGIALGSGCAPKRGAGFPGYAFVANEDGQALAAVDLTHFTVARYIKLNGKPTAVASLPGRSSVYALTPANGHVHEVSTKQLALRQSLQVGRSAISMRTTKSPDALWVLCREPRQFVCLSLEDFRVTRRIALPRDPVDFDISPDGRYAAISLTPDGVIVLVDLTAGRLAGQTRIGGELGAVRFRSDGKMLLAANLARRTLSALELPSLATVTHLPLAVRPENLCFKPDGGQLFITGEGMDAVVIVSPYYTPQVSETVLAGHFPGAMAASGSADTSSNLPNFLLVASPSTGDVAIMDVDTRRIIAVTSVGAEPAYITLTPDQQYALILNRQSGDMAVLWLARTASQSSPKNRRYPAPLFTRIPVGSRPVSVVVHQG